MVGFIEWACIEAVQADLPSGQKTVGTHIDLSHVAATPVGMTVEADVELIAKEGRTLRFRVRCVDGAGLVGEGTHERVIIDEDKFLKRLDVKKRSHNV